MSRKQTPIIICDIDGTLIDSRPQMRQLVAGKIHDADFAKQAATHLNPVKEVIEWLNRAASEGWRIEYVTGRNGRDREITQFTIRACNAPAAPLTVTKDNQRGIGTKVNLVRSHALTGAPVYVLEDEPDTIWAINHLRLPNVKVIQIPGWLASEQFSPISPTLPPIPKTNKIKPDPHSTKSVLLYSGGVDSYCAAVITNPDILLHVNLGGAYGEVETRNLNTPMGMAGRLVCVDMPQLGRYELPDKGHILPARNAILTLIAAQYGSDILMGSVAGSIGSDKDAKFAKLMTKLLAKMWEPQEKWIPEGRKTRLILPIYHLTKRQAVEEAVRKGARPEEIRDLTFSCYTPTSQGEECGKCAPCGRKWGALAAARIRPSIDAREAFKPYLDEVRNGNAEYKRTRQFIQDVLDAWNSPY